MSAVSNGFVRRMSARFGLLTLINIARKRNVMQFVLAPSKKIEELNPSAKIIKSSKEWL